MATKDKPVKTSDEVMLDVLAYEFSVGERAESERKIRRRLRYHGLEPYRQERADLLRRFKDEVQREIGRGKRSRYFADSGRGYSAMEDFDGERLAQDMKKSIPRISQKTIRAFIPFAIYLYHMR